MIGNRRFAVVLLAACSALATSHAAMAQGAPAADQLQASGDSGDIIVTARRVGESLQKVPLAVTALTSKDLQTKAVLDVNDLQKVVPSLNTLQQATGAAGLFFNLRGLIQTDTAAFQPGSVGIYQDDQYIGGAMIAGQLLNVSDLQTVEVLKGPQGTLYGRNVTGGVVKFVTQKPTDKFEGYAKVGIGNYERRLAEGMINLPLAPNVALRLNGQVDNHGGYSYDVVNKRELENANRWSVRGALKADLSPTFHVLLQGSYGKYSGNGADDRTTYIDPLNGAAMGHFQLGQFLIGNPIAGYPASTTADTLARMAQLRDAPRSAAMQYTNLQTGDHAKLATGALTLALDLSDNITLKSITSYNFANRVSRYTVGGDAETYIYSQQIGENSQWSQEFNLTGKALDGRLTFASGLFWLDQKIRDDRNPGTIGGLFPLFGGTNTTIHSVGLNNIHVQSLAPYFQGSYEIVPNVHVTGGLRYTAEKFSLTTSNLTAQGRCDGPTKDALGNVNCSASSEVSFNNLSYTWGADWTPAPGFMLYVRSGKGFKSGGVTPFITGGAPFTYFRPESNTDYEIGLKSEFLDHMVRFNVDYYHTIYKDIQRTLTVRPAPATPGGPVPPPVTGVFNAASAKIDGVEAELNVRPVSGFNLGGTLSWTKAKYSSFVIDNVNFPSGKQDISYIPFYTLPEWQYSLYANYEHPASWGAVRAGVNWSFKSGTLVGQPDTVGSPTSHVAPGGPGSGLPYSSNPLYQKGFGLLSATLAFDIAKYNTTIAFWGRNILNKRYMESGTCLVALGLGTCWAAYGAPATYGADVTIRF